ncbi:porin [Caballeronia sp. EK]|uniref:porin n=1 Tax=Caballeronia sp. EK TaxID=2767469 RepID=UPI0016559941|nr:porin [Caballeronia sp. EK]MBC8641649.1 porin [Caballeronia sp. EK]
MQVKHLCTGISLVVLAFGACPVAHAQSSVTLYGIIDEGFDYISNVSGKSFYGLVGGEVYGSRWGLKGTEDLGGGLSAVFRLESGFDPNNGRLAQGGSAFGRAAYVGLDSKSYGTVTVGRQLNASDDLWAPFTGTGSIGDFADHPLDNDNADWFVRNNNTVKYLSPTFYGLNFETTYSFSNSVGFANNRQYSAAVSYANGPFSAALMYVRADNPSATANGAVSSETAFGFIASKQQNIGVGLRYTFSNKDSVAFAYSRVDAYALPDGTLGSNATGLSLQGQNSWKFNNFDVSAQHYFSPALLAVAAYVFTTADVNAAQHSVANFHLASLMLNYDLSKRTAVYVQGAYLHTNQAAAEVFGANVAGLGLSSSQNQALARLGMTHKF